MKCRGPVSVSIRYTAGVFDASLPLVASNVNMKISSLPSVGTNTNLFDESMRIECALRPTGITCNGSGATRPSAPTAFTLITWPPYDAPNR